MPETINNEYDIGKAFAAIEDELIASMIRNMRRHKAEESDEGMQWSMWQTEQLKALEKYKRANRKKYGQQFRDINGQITELIRMARDEGEMSQEIAILKAIQKGFKAQRITRGASADFFRLNERKLEALIQATVNDMKKAETAVLRMANDQYRKAIFNAQVYANTGAGTYEKAVDMATKDFLGAGLNCIEYANGARHTLSDYADMAIRTASKRAYLQGEGVKRNEWGIHTVIVNKRGNPCPKCLPFCGKVMIDDVWSGGSSRDGPYPLISQAVAKGLYHPRCKDSHTTYFPGISTGDDEWTAEELEDIEILAKSQARQQYAERKAEKFKRLEKHSLDAENQERYGQKADKWKDMVDNGGGKEEALKAKYEAEYGIKLDSKTEKMLEQLEESRKKTEEAKQDLIRTYMEVQGMSYEDAQDVVDKFMDDTRQKIRGRQKRRKKSIAKTRDSDILSDEDVVFESRSYRNAIATEEKKIYKDDVETAVILDRNGNVVFRASSEAKNFVRFTPDQLEKMKGNVLTHNHPSNSTFSSEDVSLMAACDLNAIRATGKKKTYQLSRKSGARGNDLAEDYKAAMADNKSITDKKYANLNNDYREGTINYKEYAETVQNLNNELNSMNSEWLKSNAKSYGYRYSVIERR